MPASKQPERKNGGGQRDRFIAPSLTDKPG
jgi:hypothetical protein